jgi:hypothetical protein
MDFRISDKPTLLERYEEGEKLDTKHIYISIPIVLFLRYKTDQQERGADLSLS